MDHVSSKRERIKIMLQVSGSAAEGVRMSFGKDSPDPIARRIAADPALMEHIFDDLVGRLTEFYLDMTDDEIEETTAFYHTSAGKALNKATIGLAPRIEGIVNGWLQDVLAIAAEKRSRS